jgi:uncharacterized protein
MILPEPSRAVELRSVTPMVGQPGVHIEEVVPPPVIVGVDTAITAFVGRAARGPVDDPIPITSFFEFERVFGGLWSKSDLGHSVQAFFDQGGRKAIVVRAHRPAPGDVATLTWGRGRDRLVLDASSPGGWGRRLSARIDPLRGGRRFDLTVSDGGTGLEEAFSGVSLASGSPRRVDRVLQDSMLVRARLPLPSAFPAAVPATVAAVGGDDGARFGASAYIEPGMRESGRGIYALDRADLINLVVLPPYSATGVARTVLDAALAYADERRAMVVLDPPTTWRTAEEAVTGAPGYLTGRDAALYFPWLRRPDPLRGGRVRDFAPSGAVAGLLSRLDLSRGVWEAPAGGEAGLHGFEPSLSLTTAEIDRLGPLGVNCIRSLPGRGTVVWGARTRSDDPELRYVNVRRLELFIEQSIDRGLQWVVFEPNEETLWARVRSQIENFLLELFRQGAFPGTKPEECYFVRSGPDTMTQSDIDQGRLIVMIGFAPVRPAEFVVFRIGRWLGSDDD